MDRGLERWEIFHDKKDYKAFLSLCADIRKRFQVVFHACSLIPNHYHLMVETPEGNLSRGMRHLEGVYTQSFNRHKGKPRRVGPLFQGRYKAVLIDQEAWALELSRYIHLKPGKAKLVQRPEDHEYSSFQFCVRRNLKRPAFLETDWLLGQFHKRERSARESFLSLYP